MNKQTITRIKFIFAWQEEKESKWLREMSREGWHLISVGIFVYKFVRGELVDYIYKMDYNPKILKDKEEYFQLFSDAGWTCVAQIAGWYYFRIRADEGKVLEIYTDNSSQIKKYQRLVITLILACLPSLLPVVTFFSGVYESRILFYVGVFVLIILSLLFYAIIQVLLLLKRLKNKENL
jgi:hypothetical protein